MLCLNSIVEKLEEIEPSFNPVPFYDEDGYEIDGEQKEEEDCIDEEATANDTEEVTPETTVDTPGVAETLDTSGENVMEIQDAEQINGLEENGHSPDGESIEIEQNVTPISPEVVQELPPVESEPNDMAISLINHI